MRCSGWSCWAAARWKLRRRMQRRAICRWIFIVGVKLLTNKSCCDILKGQRGGLFPMLETVCEVCDQRLAASRRLQAIAAACESYWGWRKSRSRHDGRLTGLALFDHSSSEISIICAALDWSHDGGAVELEVRLAAALAQFWVVLGYASEGWERLKVPHWSNEAEQQLPYAQTHSAFPCCFQCIWLAIPSRWPFSSKKHWRSTRRSAMPGGSPGIL